MQQFCDEQAEKLVSQVKLHCLGFELTKGGSRVEKQTGKGKSEQKEREREGERETAREPNKLKTICGADDLRAHTT